MALVFDQGFVRPVLEALLGGDPGSARSVTRPITPLEWNLLQPVAELVCRSLGEAWADLVRTEFEVQALFDSPERLRNIEAAGAVFAVRFTSLFQGVPGSIRLALPVSVLDNPAFEEPVNQVEGGSGQLEMLHRVADGNVILDIRVPASQVSLRDLASLRPGQILQLDHGIDGPLGGYLNQDSRQAVTGTVVANENRRAFRVQSIVVATD
jgi:flagellar motor switch protein FliM